MCRSGGSAPTPPTLPPPPELPTNQQGLDTENIFRILSGFYDESGNLNMDAVQQFGSRFQERFGAEQDIYGRAIGFLGGFLDQSPSEFDTFNDRIASAEQERYLRALSGDVPVSQALEDQRRREFQIFKESAGRRGISITGDTPEEATSESTAGIRMLSEFNRRYDLARENERQAELSFGSGQNLRRIGLMSDVSSRQFNQGLALSQLGSGGYTAPLGFLGSATDLSTGRLDREYSRDLYAYDIANQNRLNSYNAALQNYQSSQQRRAGMFQSLGYLGGLGGSSAILAGHPLAGAAVLGGTGLVGLFG